MPGSFENCEEFASRYGYPPEEYLIKVVKGLLHPNPARYDIEGIDPSERAQGIAGDATRKAAAEKFLADGFTVGENGLTAWDRLLPYMGSVSHDIVRECSPDLDLVLASVRE